MNQKLPLDGYKWANAAIFTDHYVKNYDAKGDQGYLLEVDVEYPIRLRSDHEDLPFLAERRQKRSKQPVDYEFDKINRAHRKVYKTFNINPEPENKLIATVRDKEKHIVSLSTLKQALDHGLRLTKVYKAIELNQSAWFKPYIDMNTKFRATAKNDFEKNFFKLMNNSVFGKILKMLEREEILS